jgi:hypothetical protein
MVSPRKQKRISQDPEKKDDMDHAKREAVHHEDMDKRGPSARKTHRKASSTVEGRHKADTLRSSRKTTQRRMSKRRSGKKSQRKSVRRSKRRSSKRSQRKSVRRSKRRSGKRSQRRTVGTPKNGGVRKTTKAELEGDNKTDSIFDKLVHGNRLRRTSKGKSAPKRERKGFSVIDKIVHGEKQTGLDRL